MEKVLVLGGHGFLGAAVAAAFAAGGRTVVVRSRRDGVDARDVTALLPCLEAERPDWLVNCAAHVGGIAYNARCPVAIYEDNLLIGFNVVRCARQAGVAKLINVMPNCTYPGEMELYSEPRWWDGPMHPTVLTYGMPRKAVWVHAWACQQQFGLRSIHLVLPNLYGPRDHFDIIRSHALGALIRKVVDAREQGLGTVEIWGTGAPVREWMYVEDAAAGILRAAERYDAMDILNLGCGKGCSIRELAELVRAAANWRGEFVYATDRPDGAPRKILDTGRMQAALDWWPPTPLREGIVATVAWYEQHRRAAAALPTAASAGET